MTFSEGEKQWSNIDGVFVPQQLGRKQAQPGDVSFYSEAMRPKKQWPVTSESFFWDF